MQYIVDLTLLLDLMEQKILSVSSLLVQAAMNQRCYHELPTSCIFEYCTLYS